MLQTWLLRLGTIFFRRPKFRRWAVLEDRKYDAIKAVEQGAPDFPLFVFGYISTALTICPKKFNKVYWQDALKAFLKIHSVTAPDASLPLVSLNSDKRSERDAWDYSGRLWYFYANIFASAYGWSEKQIAGLSVDAALSYMQEILTAEQFEKEFQHRLAETSYSYDKATKKSKYIPLPKPYWMVAKKKDVPKVISIRADMLPVGVIEKFHAPKEAKS